MKISILLLFISLFAKTCNSQQVLNNQIDEISDPLAIIQKDNFETGKYKWEIAYGTWQIRPDGSNMLLSHTSDEDYGVALFKSTSFKDVDVTVNFRPVSGDTDQSGGVIFRAINKDNYYLVRANALEGNLRFYKTIDGNRQTLHSVSINKPTKNQWHSLRVIMKSDHLQAFLDGKMLIDEHDTSLVSGLVGLWTKADSETDFKDFSVKGVKN
jgi:hypothetical protein